MMILACVRQNSNLSVSALALIVHLKQLLISKLQQDLEVDHPSPTNRGTSIRLLFKFDLPSSRIIAYLTF